MSVKSGRAFVPYMSSLVEEESSGFKSVTGDEAADELHIVIYPAHDRSRKQAKYDNILLRDRGFGFCPLANNGRDDICKIRAGGMLLRCRTAVDCCSL